MQGNCVIYASCENAELLSITDRIYVMYDGHIMAELETAKTNEDEIMRCIVGDNLQYGDTVTVVATVQGLDNVPYLVQWQYDDGAGWKNREGATQASYSFTLSRENAAYQWRVMVTVA